MFTNRLFKLQGLEAHPPRRMTMKTIMFVLLFTLALSACTPQATATPILTSVPVSTSVPSATKAPIPSLTPTATLDHGNIPPELVGTWSFTAFGESWTAKLTADGKYSLYPSDGQLDISGSYGISGSEAVFRDEIAGNGVLCVPAEARYQWELKGDRLVFTVIEDKCPIGRIEQWTAGWQRVKK